MSRRLRRVVEQLEARTLFATTTFSFAAAEHAAVETNFYTPHGGDFVAITIVRDGDVSSAATSTVWLDTPLAGGTATAFEDFQPATMQQITFTAGARAAVVTIPVLSDFQPEADETIALRLYAESNPAEGATPLSTSSITIYDDDNNQPAVVRFAASSFAGPEHPFYGPMTPVEIKRTGSYAEFTTASLAGHAASAAPGVRPATENADFMPGGQTFFFNPGDTVQGLFIPINADGIPELDEQFGLTLAAGNEIPAPGAGESRLYSILDADGGTTLPRISIADASVHEGDFNSPNGNLTLSLSLSAASDQPIFVTVNSVQQSTFGLPGVADPGSDYQQFSAFVTFQPGQTSTSVTLPGVILGDDFAEPDETFAVALDLLSNNAVIDDGSATVTIVDNEPRFSIGDAQVLEGTNIGEPATKMRFPVTLSRASDQPTYVWARLVANSGTATEGFDYFVNSDTFIPFSPGQTQGEFVVSIVPDQLAEEDETFDVDLYNAVGATIGDGTATGTILEDDAPVFFIDDASLREGSGEVDRVANVVVRLLRPVSIAASVQVVFNPGTAGPGDYFAGGEYVTFASGESTRTVAVPINADFEVEANETFTAELVQSSTQYRIADGTATITLLDDDRGGHFQFADGVAGIARLEGSLTGPITITRDIPVRPASVRYTIVPGSAGPDDYGRFPGANGAVTGVVEFAAGVNSVTLGDLPILDDDLDELDETFTIVLSDPSDGASIPAGRESLAVMIFDTDPTLPTLAVDDVTVVETAGGSFADFTVSLTGPLWQGSPAFVNYSTASDTASTGDDFTSTSGQISFTEGGPTTQTVRVPVIDDNVYEPGAAERFFLRLTSPDNAKIADGEGAATITDDDPMFGWFEFLPGSASVAEDGGSVGVGLTFTPTVPAPGVIVDRPQSLNIGWTIYGGVPGENFAAAPGSDYEHRNGRIDFSGSVAGGAFIETQVFNDTIAEPDERFAFWMHEPAPEGTAYRADKAPVTLLDDDRGGVFTIATSHSTRTEGETAIIEIYRSGTEEAAEVDVVTVDGTATTTGGDFTAVSQRLTFASGETYKTVAVATKADGTNVEADEQFTVELRNPSANANVSTSQSSVGVTVRETYPNGLLRLIPESPATGVTEGQNFNFRLERVGRADGFIGFNLSQVSGTIAPIGDIFDGNPFVSLAAGQYSKSFSIRTLTDRTDDGDKTVRFALPFSGAPGVITGAVGDPAFSVFDVNILDADPAPKLEIGDLTIVEGTGSGKTAMVPVRLYGSIPRQTPGMPTSLQIGYSIVHGTTDPLDAFSVSGVVGFSFGSYDPAVGMTAYAQVDIRSDGLDEDDETFTVVLNPNQVLPPGTPIDIVDGEATVTILDDDSAPRIASVFVSGSGWTQNFRNHLAATGQGDATHGFAIDPAAATDELPWTNLDRISVRFDKSIQQIGQSSLLLRGLNVPTYASSGFSFDFATNTATWSFAAPFAVDRLQAVVTNVLDNAGNPMTTANGTFYLDVLPGDVNRSGGSVIGSDVTLVRNAQNSPPGGEGSLYTIFKDVNGSASIVGSDVTAVRNRQGFRLPTGTFVTGSSNATDLAVMTDRASDLMSDEEL